MIPILRKGQRLTKELTAQLFDSVNHPSRPITYLGIDPGKSNGICGYTADYQLQFMMTVTSNDMIQFVDQFRNVTTIVVEDYKLYPNKANHQAYSDMETSRVIGRLEYMAELRGVKLVKQMATIKTTGYAWLGIKPLPKSNPQNHEYDAHVHFMYWAVKTGKLNAADLIKDETRKDS